MVDTPELLMSAFPRVNALYEELRVEPLDRTQLGFELGSIQTKATTRPARTRTGRHKPRAISRYWLLLSSQRLLLLPRLASKLLLRPPRGLQRKRRSEKNGAGIQRSLAGCLPACLPACLPVRPTDATGRPTHRPPARPTHTLIRRESHTHTQAHTAGSSRTLTHTVESNEKLRVERIHSHTRTHKSIKQRTKDSSQK